MSEIVFLKGRLGPPLAIYRRYVLNRESVKYSLRPSEKHFTYEPTRFQYLPTVRAFRITLQRL